MAAAHATEIVHLLDVLPDLDDPNWHRETVLARLHNLHTTSSPPSATSQPPAAKPSGRARHVR
jgi:hypothetical protein